MQITNPLPQTNIFRGCLVAPLAAPVAALLVGPLFDRELSFVHAPLIFIGTLIPAYLSMFVIALPLALLLRSQRRLSAGMFISLFAAACAFLASILGLNGVLGFHRQGAMGLAVLTALVAAAVGFVWCLAAGVTFRRKPG